MGELTPAPTGYAIKPVRDNTASIINFSGVPGDLFYAQMEPGPEWAEWMRKKLGEEVLEYIVKPGLDELGDVLAAIESLAHEHGTDLEGLTRQMHADPRGGFLNRQMMYGRHEEFDGK